MGSFVSQFHGHMGLLAVEPLSNKKQQQQYLSELQFFEVWQSDLIENSNQAIYKNNIKKKIIQ